MTLVHDLHGRWGAALWLGAEWRLFAFEALLYVALNSALRSAATVALVTYVISAALGAARRRLGAANLARKALVDRHFLI
jgi:hypothetical protein